MKKIRFLVVLFCALYILGCDVSAQELLADPSFEKLKSCPDNIGELDETEKWFNPINTTSDLFSKCKHSGKNEWIAGRPVNIPSNFVGYQQPHTGDNYAGFIAYDAGNLKWSEYIATKFTDSLKARSTYCFKMFISLADYSKNKTFTPINF